MADIEKKSDGERTSLWAGLAVGLGIAALTGFAGVVIYMIYRARTLNAAAQPQLSAPPQVIYLDGSGYGDRQRPQVITVPSVSTPVPTLSAARPRRERGGGSLMKSYRLPVLTDPNSSSARVATAPTDKEYRVLLRVISPPGAYAAFSNDGSELNGGAAFPVGNTFIIPTGEDNQVHLHSGEAIFAKGSVPNVVVSVALTEVIN